MPVYTYRCSNCGFVFDQQQKFSDSSLTKCPECGKKTLNKVFQPVGIVFKGSGFYATDHRSPSGQGRYSNTNKSGEGSERSAGSDRTAGSEKSGDSDKSTGRDKSGDSDKSSGGEKSAERSKSSTSSED